MPLKQYSAVRIIRLLRLPEEYDGWNVNQRPPRIGDRGVIVDIFQTVGQVDNYVVESCGPDGIPVWMGDFSSDELEDIDNQTPLWKYFKHMPIKSLAILCCSATLLCLISIFLLDHPLANWVHNSSLESTGFFVRGTQWLDLVTGRTLFANRSIDTLLLGSALTAIGIFFLFINSSNYTARALAFIGTIELTTVLAASAIKNLFGRLRPYELFASGDWSHAWHAGGNSFPSGHVSFYWGLFLPLMYLFSRFRIPLFIIPIFIACARINESMHFLSDVLGAIALASFITLLAAIVLQRWIRPTSR